MSLKLDMSKAYDKVEWDYLEKSLVILGFPPHFVHLVMQYVRSASFLVLTNGFPKGPIMPSRGIR